MRIKRKVNAIRTTLLLVLAAVIASCGGGTGWDADQKAIHGEMVDWAMYVTKGDAEAMWEMLSPDAQDIYERELKGERGVRQTVKLTKASLGKDSQISPERRKELEATLADFPPDPDKMTAKDYYVWKTKPKLTPEAAQSNESAFAKTNIKEISIEGDRATVVVKNGDPKRYSWVRHDGVWKFDVKPSILRALEIARKRESDNN